MTKVRWITTLGPTRAGIVLRGSHGSVNGSVYWPPTALPPESAAPLAIVVSPADGVPVAPGSLAQALATHAGMVAVRLDGGRDADLDDTWDAAQWVADHAGEIDGDAGRLLLLGQAEATAAVAAMTAFARDAGWPALARQVLVLAVPHRDDRAGAVQPRFPDDVAGLAPCTVVDIGAAAGTERAVDARAGPMLAYTERLRGAGVPVRFSSVRPATWKLDPARAVVDALVADKSTNQI